MKNDPNKAQLSSAQVRYLDGWVPAQLNWLKIGVVLGSSPERRFRRTRQALIRKDVITPDGQITDTGLNAYQRAVDKLKKKKLHELVTSAGSRDQGGEDLVVGVE